MIRRTATHLAAFATALALIMFVGTHMKAMV